MGRMKKVIKAKEPVKIREKVIKGDNRSLYLDIYYNGVRKKEALQLYLVPEVDFTAKLQNANTRKLAEQIKAKRILDIQRAGIVDCNRVKNGSRTLASSMQFYIDEGDELSRATKRLRAVAKVRVDEFLLKINQPNLALTEVDKSFCKGFIAYLKTCTYNHGKIALSATSQRMYANCLSSVLNKAVRDGLIDQNPMELLESCEKTKKCKSMREFLTIDELKALIATDCKHEIVKKAFLFSCFTGLRYSDVKSLRWSEIHQSADGKTFYIEHKQVKTKNYVTIPLSNEALRWMPERVDGIDQVFYEFNVSDTTVVNVLKSWTKAAGITKHISFHCSRHTAATLAIAAGAELYTVSKLLGHTNIKTTQIYAKVNMVKEIEAVNLTDGLFS